MAAKKKTGTTKKSAPASKAGAKVGKVMNEFKHGELKSGGKSKVKNPKQAIAIGLSEARRAGADIPTAKRKSASKGAGSRTQAKTATKKTAAKKTAVKKSGARKTAATKSPRK